MNGLCCRPSEYMRRLCYRQWNWQAKLIKREPHSWDLWQRTFVNHGLWRLTLTASYSTVTVPSQFFENRLVRFLWLTVKCEGVTAALYCNIFSWEPEGRYWCTNSMTIAPFWFSTEHPWTVLKPFWLSTDDSYMKTNIKFTDIIHIYMSSIFFLQRSPVQYI